MERRYWVRFSLTTFGGYEYGVVGEPAELGEWDVSHCVPMVPFGGVQGEFATLMFCDVCIDSLVAKYSSEYNLDTVSTLSTVHLPTVCTPPQGKFVTTRFCEERLYLGEATTSERHSVGGVLGLQFPYKFIRWPRQSPNIYIPSDTHLHPPPVPPHVDVLRIVQDRLTRSTSAPQHFLEQPIQQFPPPNPNQQNHQNCENNQNCENKPNCENRQNWENSENWAKSENSENYTKKDQNEKNNTKQRTPRRSSNPSLYDICVNSSVIDYDEYSVVNSLKMFTPYSPPPVPIPRSQVQWESGSQNRTFSSQENVVVFRVLPDAAVGAINDQRTALCEQNLEEKNPDQNPKNYQNGEKNYKMNDEENKRFIMRPEEAGYKILHILDVTSFREEVGERSEYSQTTEYYEKIKANREMHYQRVLSNVYCGSTPRSIEQVQYLKEVLGVGVVFNLQTLLDAVRTSALAAASQSTSYSESNPESALEHMYDMYEKQGLEYLWLPTTDMCSKARIAAVPIAAYLLEGLLKPMICSQQRDKPKAYVHCNAGVGRSAAACAGYMAFALQIPLPLTQFILKARRPVTYWDAHAMANAELKFKRKFGHKL